MSDKENRCYKLERAMRDLHGFIQWALDHNAEKLIVPTVNHDLAGLINDEPGFSPRSFGYATSAMDTARSERAA